MPRPEPSYLQDLALSTQDGRVRAVLGVRNGPLPPLGPKWLEKYRDYLSRTLSLPFCAVYHEAVSPLEEVPHVVTVLDLCTPAEAATEGLMCRVTEDGKTIEVPLMELEVDPQSPNFALIEDYWYWAWNGRRSGRATS